MALRRETSGGRNFCQRLIGVLNQPAGVFDSTLLDEGAGGCPG